MPQYKIGIIGEDNLIKNMFEERGAVVTTLGNPLQEAENKFDFNLVVFTGGSDVSPWLYGEKNTTSYTNQNRDIREVLWYHRFLNTPKVGICRGGQFLFVMNGGKMDQHIDGHGNSHRLKYHLWTPEGLDNSVTSTHHQHMANPHANQSVLASNPRDGVNEIVWSGYSQSLSFQPHPEYEDMVCREIFFWHIKKMFKMNFMKAAAAPAIQPFQQDLVNAINLGAVLQGAQAARVVFDDEDVEEERR